LRKGSIVFFLLPGVSFFFPMRTCGEEDGRRFEKISSEGGLIARANYEKKSAQEMVNRPLSSSGGLCLLLSSSPRREGKRAGRRGRRFESDYRKKNEERRREEAGKRGAGRRPQGGMVNGRFINHMPESAAGIVVFCCRYAV